MTRLPKNTESVSVSLPSWLLEELDAYVERTNYTRSGLMTKATRQYLWKEKESLERWGEEYQRSHGL